jgi:hypothetical protein
VLRAKTSLAAELLEERKKDDAIDEKRPNKKSRAIPDPASTGC